MNGLEQSEHLIVCSHTSKTTHQNHLLNEYLLSRQYKKVKNTLTHHRHHKDAVRYYNNSTENHNTQCYQQRILKNLIREGLIRKMDEIWTLCFFIMYFFPPEVTFTETHFIFHRKMGFLLKEDFLLFVFRWELDWSLIFSAENTVKCLFNSYYTTAEPYASILKEYAITMLMLHMHKDSWLSRVIYTFF